MAVLFINESNPPSEVVGGKLVEMPGFFPPSGVVKKDDWVHFDDREFIKQCRSVYIESITFFTGDVLSGLEVNYVLDGLLKKVTHGTTAGQKHTLDLGGEDHINQIESTNSEAGIHSLRITTNERKQLNAVGTKGPAADKINFSCQDSRRGVVAFKGQHQTHMTCLIVYTWKLVKSVRNPN